MKNHKYIYKEKIEGYVIEYDENFVTIMFIDDKYHQEPVRFNRDKIEAPEKIFINQPVVYYVEQTNYGDIKFYFDFLEACLPDFDLLKKDSVIEKIKNEMKEVLE